MTPDPAGGRPPSGESALRPDGSHQAPTAEPPEDIALGDVPEPVRRRLIGYATEALRAMKPTDAPPPLRVATRWRHGAVPRRFAEQVLDALSEEAAFRSRVWAHIVEGRDGGTEPPTDESSHDDARSEQPDPVARAAELYLDRPPGWAAQFRQELSAAAPSADPQVLLRAAQREAESLRTKLDRLQQRRERELAAAKQAEAELRVRHAESLERLREQVQQAQSQAEEAVAARDLLQRRVTELDREARRLRADNDRVRTKSEQARSTGRDARLAATARAKVLLDLLQAAVAGLGEELAVPASTPAPADLVPASVPTEPAPKMRLMSGGDLNEVLTLPRCHLLVDGYNVSKGAWPRAPLQQQRDRLISALTALAARTRAEITVVFDGADVGAVPAASSRAVRVRFSASGELADRVIVRMVAVEPAGRPVVVVSSDGALTAGARAAGARTADREVLMEVLALR